MLLHESNALLHRITFVDILDNVNVDQLSRVETLSRVLVVRVVSVDLHGENFGVFRAEPRRVISGDGLEARE